MDAATTLTLSLPERCNAGRTLAVLPAAAQPCWLDRLVSNQVVPKPVVRPLAASMLALACMAGAAGNALAAPGLAGRTAASTPAAPPLRQWILQSGDNEQSPFIIIDKRRARLWLFSQTGEPLGDTPVLLGLAPGDASVPGIGEREMKDIQRHERTTPAGRFVAEAGRNAAGEDIFWIDYDAAVSMHRVRGSNPVEKRLARLASATSADNRISYGCINVPASFYDRHIRPAFEGRRGVVYVLPETIAPGVLFKTGPGATATSGTPGGP